MSAPHTTPTPFAACIRTPLPQPAYLPMSRAEMDRLGWQELDVLLVSGDAYVDHPSFGIPLLGRLLVAHGLRTGIIAQPDWERGPEALTGMGRPRLFAGLSAGALDSMLAHYTAFRKKRHDDAYTPGGQAGARPNRAVTVYANLLRRTFPGLPLVAGGIEASLRRLTHYDFWTDGLRRSILFDARLDLLVCGMGESALLTAAARLDAALAETGVPPGPQELGRIWAGIAGTARLVRQADVPALITGRDPIVLPSHEAQLADPAALLHATLLHERHSHQAARPLMQTCGDRAVWLEPPAPPLPTAALDALYALPFTRRAHPAYTGVIPAATMIAHSITTHRGCAGGCSFCSLALHQGRRIASRSRDSVLDEAGRLAAMPDFSGAISDVGGPSANMWQAYCRLDPTGCTRPSCLHPSVCKGFMANQAECIELLRAVRAVPGVRHVRVASGVRFDLAMREPTALTAYTGEFTGGQLKAAPEHCVDTVLALMRKPKTEIFEVFLEAFARQSRQAHKEQYVVPYLMSAFPGCTDADMRTLAAWLAARNWTPQQVQCFIPTPGTVAAAMFYSGLAPDGAPMYVARSDAERLRQHGLLAPREQMRGTEPPRARRCAPQHARPHAEKALGKKQKQRP